VGYYEQMLFREDPGRYKKHGNLMLALCWAAILIAAIAIWALAR
jgi:hypothetical protein